GLGHAGDFHAVHLDDRVARFEAGLGGGRVGRDGVDDGGRAVNVAAAGDEAQVAAVEVLPLLEPREHGGHVLVGDGEADAGVVPLVAGRLVLAARRGGYEDALHPALHVHERAAVVDRRHLGIGLHRLAPDAVQRADDAHADARRGVGAGPGAAQGEGVLADLDVLLGGGLRHWQAGGVDL